MSDKHRIVVIGGGFGGLNFAKKIDKKTFDVTVVDCNNYHSFPPLFYQVASGGLEPASISFPLRSEFHGRRLRGVRFVMGRVTAIDTVRQKVITDYDEISYDTLVIAAGTTNNFFGIEGLEERVLTLKSTSEAIRARNEILLRLEHATMESDPARRRSLLTFAVVGGGPTGVEIAGSLGEMKRYVIARDYPTLDVSEVRVILVEGTDRLLRTMSLKSSADAYADLIKLGVDVRLSTAMKSYDGETLNFGDGSSIDAKTLIWTAGISAVPFKFIGTNVKPGPGGRLVTDAFNLVEGTDNIYAIGDIALHTDERYPRGCPQLAQAAIQQGATLARNLNRPDDRKPFEYNDKGSMATIGRNRAVVDMKHVHFRGWFAWIVWMGVHLMSLLGMRKKAIVLLNWTWSYFSFSSALRLILRPSCQPESEDSCCE